VAVGDHPRRVGRPELREHVAQLVVGDVVRKVAYVELHETFPRTPGQMGEVTAGTGGLAFSSLISFGLPERLRPGRANREPKEPITFPRKRWQAPKPG